MCERQGIWNATVDQLKAGYVEDETGYTCLCCGRQFEKGIVYQADGVLYEALRYTRHHIATEHQSVFHQLIRQGKRVTGLSETQRRLLELSYHGLSDAELQKELGIGSASTIRNHRFQLREKERQARVFLAIMELLREREGAVAAPPRARSKANPQRGVVNGQEKALQQYFPYGVEGPLKSLSIRGTHRRMVLATVAQRFTLGRGYTEMEVNQLLENVHADYVTLRRYLVDDGFLRRLPDGSRYWRHPSESDAGQGESGLDRRELKRLARETPTEAGILQIKNERNGKLFIDSIRNLKMMNGQRFQLEMGSHKNKGLQREWQEYGPDAFTFQVLETLKREEGESPYFDEADALKELLARWLERLQPYGDRGYNVRKDQG